MLSARPSVQEELHLSDPGTQEDRFPSGTRVASFRLLPQGVPFGYEPGRRLNREPFSAGRQLPLEIADLFVLYTFRRHLNFVKVLCFD